MEGGLELTPDAWRPADERALRERLQSIALAEMSRRRAWLGQISPEQERAIGELLSATAGRISGLVTGRARACYLRGDGGKARALLAAFD